MVEAADAYEDTVAEAAEAVEESDSVAWWTESP